MNTPKDYDTTIARIAGNIAGGLMTNDWQQHHQIDVDTVAETSVMLALAIVAEVRRQMPRDAEPNAKG